MGGVYAWNYFVRAYDNKENDSLFRGSSAFCWPVITCLLHEQSNYEQSVRE
jgi:hypothetical protein